MKLLNLALLALVVATALAAPASAVTLVSPSGALVGAPWQSWADAAGLPSGEVTLALPDATTAWYSQSYIQIPISFSTQDNRILNRGLFFTNGQQALIHELGHWIDDTRMSETDRTRFAVLINRPSAPWWQYPNATGEKFAQAFMLCALVPNIPLNRQFQSYAYGWAPTHATQVKVCSFIKEILSRG